LFEFRWTITTGRLDVVRKNMLQASFVGIMLCIIMPLGDTDSSHALEIKIQEKEAYIIIYLLDPTCIR
jgi:hypothetical protein